MCPKQSGIKSFRKFREQGRHLNTLRTSIQRWLIHTLANFEHHRNGNYIDEVFRLAEFTEEEKRIAQEMLGSMVERQLALVNHDFYAFLSFSRHKMLIYALSLNLQKANALYHSFSRRVSEPCGIFRYADLQTKQRQILLKRSHLSWLLALRLCFDSSRRRLSSKAIASVLSRRSLDVHPAFDYQSIEPREPISSKIVGRILPLELPGNGLLRSFRRYHDSTDSQCNFVNHPSLPFRFKCAPDNTVTVYFTTGVSEISVLEVPFMQSLM
jgi:hypothetical protein